MSTEAALYTGHDDQATKYIAVPERAVRHLLGSPGPWRICGPTQEVPALTPDLGDRVISWVSPELRRVAVAPAVAIGLISSNDDSFAAVFGVDGLEGDRAGSVARVVMDAPLLERLPDCWRPHFLKALDR